MEWLPEGLDGLPAMILIVSAMGTSFLTAAFGIGGGVTLLAIMALIMPPVVLIPVHGVVQMGSNAGRAAVMIRHVRWPVLGAFAIGAVLGTVIGGMVAINLPPWLVQVGLALFILYSAWGPKPNLGRAGLWLGGMISSFLTMFFGATGPFVAGLMKTQGLDRLDHVGTFSACMTLQHMLKIVAFGLLGFAFADWVPLMVAMIAAGFIGTVVGKQLLMRMGDGRFHTILNVLLTLLALRLLWQGVSQM